MRTNTPKHVAVNTDRFVVTERGKRERAREREGRKKNAQATPNIPPPSEYI